jgi:hypothetical protein
MEWVDVKKELPPEPGHYLCWEEFYSPSIKPVVGWYDAEGFITEIADDYSNVTHWMPLPDPPMGGVLKRR